MTQHLVSIAARLTAKLRLSVGCLERAATKAVFSIFTEDVYEDVKRPVSVDNQLYALKIVDTAGQAQVRPDRPRYLSVCTPKEHCCSSSPPLPPLSLLGSRDFLPTSACRVCRCSVARVLTNRAADAEKCGGTKRAHRLPPESILSLRFGGQQERLDPLAAGEGAGGAGRG